MGLGLGLELGLGLGLGGGFRLLILTRTLTLPRCGCRATRSARRSSFSSSSARGSATAGEPAAGWPAIPTRGSGYGSGRRRCALRVSTSGRRPCCAKSVMARSRIIRNRGCFGESGFFALSSQFCALIKYPPRGTVCPVPGGAKEAASAAARPVGAPVRRGRVWPCTHTVACGWGLCGRRVFCKAVHRTYCLHTGCHGMDANDLINETAAGPSYTAAAGAASAAAAAGRRRSR